MRLPFLDRQDELTRLERLVKRKEGAFGVLYGRRRCGKSRLLREATPPESSVFFEQLSQPRSDDSSRASTACPTRSGTPSWSAGGATHRQGQC